MGKKMIFATLITFLVTLIISSAALAQTFSLSVSPPLLEVLIKPGKTITQVYQVTNQSDKDIILTAWMVPFEASDEQGNIHLIFDKALFDKSINWFSLQNADKELAVPFTLKAGQSEELVLKIKVPPKAQEKDYYYTLIIKNTPQILTTGQIRSVASGIIGSNILLSVSPTGEPPTDLEIDQFSLRRFLLLTNLVDSFDLVSFKAVIKNKSQHFSKMTGKIILKDSRGQLLRQLALFPNNILSQTKREAVCTDAPTCDLPRSWLFGRYQATLFTTNQEGTAEKSFFFFVLPVRATGLLLITLLLALVVLKFFRSTSSPKPTAK